MWKGIAVGLVLLLPVGACATSSLPPVPNAGPDLIIQEQILSTNSTNAYEAVQKLRPNWLRVRGQGITNSGMIQVYIDDVRIGGVGVLRQLTSTSVYSIRWYDGITATGRWGIDHGNGVIFVRTMPAQ